MPRAPNRLLTRLPPLLILRTNPRERAENNEAKEERMTMTPDEPGSLAVPGVGTEKEIREPKMYRVILHNDDYTTMDFVVEVLMSIFHKPAADATRIMIDVHKKGKGVCGVYTYDIAATRVARVHHLAQKREFPLKCSLEEA
jgi:ATP-dependent Clp protease adaptor protein ClpS